MVRAGGPLTPRTYGLQQLNEQLRLSGTVQSRAAGINPDGTSMAFELADVKAWTLLSRYFALKIRAATALQIFRMAHDEEEQHRAIVLLEEGLHRRC